ncbi:hypothetical protein VTL71DRAFT_15327 [Oculimacula yallundae]|uniref:Uncharacterized protein n=1 Tax=Oculimacula yallundae TaxID=86028 RepID=A0ABR4CIK4_9HELO
MQKGKAKATVQPYQKPKMNVRFTDNTTNLITGSHTMMKEGPTATTSKVPKVSNPSIQGPTPRGTRMDSNPTASSEIKRPSTPYPGKVLPASAAQLPRNITDGNGPSSEIYDISIRGSPALNKAHQQHSASFARAEGQRIHEEEMQELRANQLPHRPQEASPPGPPAKLPQVNRDRPKVAPPQKAAPVIPPSRRNLEPPKIAAPAPPKHQGPSTARPQIKPSHVETGTPQVAIRQERAPNAPASHLNPQNANLAAPAPATPSRHAVSTTPPQPKPPHVERSGPNAPTPQIQRTGHNVPVLYQYPNHRNFTCPYPNSQPPRTPSQARLPPPIPMPMPMPVHRSPNHHRPDSTQRSDKSQARNRVPTRATVPDPERKSRPPNKLRKNPPPGYWLPKSRTSEPKRRSRSRSWKQRVKAAILSFLGF